MTELVVVDSNPHQTVVEALQYSLLPALAKRVRFTARGLDLPPDLELEQAQAITHYLAEAIIRTEIESGLLRLFLGNIINYSEAKFGDMYSQWLDSTGLAYGTLANAAWVARQVDPSRWREELSFTHHVVVAPLEPAEQSAWLQEAVDAQIGPNELRRQIQASKDIADGRNPEQAEIERALTRIANKMSSTLGTTLWADTIMSGLIKPLCVGLRDATEFANRMNALTWDNIDGPADDNA